MMHTNSTRDGIWCENLTLLCLSRVLGCYLKNKQKIAVLAGLTLMLAWRLGGLVTHSYQLSASNFSYRNKGTYESINQWFC